jgi:hypothetical protein
LGLGGRQNQIFLSTAWAITRSINPFLNNKKTKQIFLLKEKKFQRQPREYNLRTVDAQIRQGSRLSSITSHPTIKTHSKQFWREVKGAEVVVSILIYREWSNNFDIKITLSTPYNYILYLWKLLEKNILIMSYTCHSYLKDTLKNEEYFVQPFSFYSINFACFI